MTSTNYIYTLQKEDLQGNILSKKKRYVVRYRDELKVGSLYIHLPEFKSGMYRVIAVKVKEFYC